MRGLNHFILLFLLTFAAFSCKSDDDARGPERNPAPVTAVQGPDTATVGQKIELQVSFEVRNECGRLGYFSKDARDKTFTVYAHPIYSNNACAQVSKTVTAPFHFTMESAGTYTFKFWAGDGSFVTKIVEVK